jgi:hypothetical protein
VQSSRAGQVRLHQACCFCIMRGTYGVSCFRLQLSVLASCQVVDTVKGIMITHSQVSCFCIM